MHDFQHAADFGFGHEVLAHHEGRPVRKQSYSHQQEVYIGYVGTNHDGWSFYITYAGTVVGRMQLEFKIGCYYQAGQIIQKRVGLLYNLFRRLFAHFRTSFLSFLYFSCSDKSIPITRRLGKAKAVDGTLKKI